ncbi:MAG: hypothetical protein RIR65_1723 [Planctomycetota bacterium]
MTGWLRSRTLQFVALLALCALALRRVEGLERACAWLLAPSASIASVLAPFEFGREVRAADAELEAASREVRALYARNVLPDEAQLRAGRAFVACEVVARVPGAPDRVLVRAEDHLAVRVGDPATLRGHYLGRVAAERDGEWEIELATARDHRVGAVARAEDEVARLVVGGLRRAPSEDGAALLAAWALDDHDLDGALVRVQESASGSAALHGPELASAQRANGYLLGELRAPRRGAALPPGVRTELDWEHGLHHLAILVDPRATQDAATRVDARDPLDPRRWMELETVARRAATPGRAVQRVKDPGQLRVGAAVADGLRLRGRVERVASGVADVALLEDPRCAVEALAVVDAARVVSLGSLRGAGRVDSGSVLLACDVAALQRLRAAMERAPDASVSVWTAGSERGVPAALLVGELLPQPGGGRALRIAHAEGTTRPSLAWTEQDAQSPEVAAR